MIEPRTAISIERRHRVRVDLRGDGSVIGEIASQTKGREYICLVLGDVPKGETVTVPEIIAAAQRLVNRSA